MAAPAMAPAVASNPHCQFPHLSTFRSHPALDFVVPIKNSDLGIRISLSSNVLIKDRQGHARTLCVRSLRDVSEITVLDRTDLETQLREVPNLQQELTCVMKFGGSSLASADRMKEVANLISSFPNERPVIVLSAMGKTTNNLLKMNNKTILPISWAGATAINCGVGNSCTIGELHVVKDLHLRTVDELGITVNVISGLIEELEGLLKGISLMKELTNRTKDYLVSFGERMSSRIFAAYLNKLGLKSKQYDAPDIGFVTTDDFMNADILEDAYPALAKALLDNWNNEPAIPIITGFLGKGKNTGAITTLGRGGSDLTATALGRALGLREIQIWKDVDGVLTCDPNIHSNALPVPFLTFDEAAELAYFGAQVLHPQSMRPAREANIPVRVKNSYKTLAAGTLITKTRDLSKSLLTSIVLKSNVTLLDIVSTRMLGHYGFLAKVFQVFQEFGISVDVVATSEVSISLTLDPIKTWDREFVHLELDATTLALVSRKAQGVCTC